jgi:heterodisulfide reductase subunit B
MRKKLENVRASGAQLMATACTYCQMQLGQQRDQLPPDDPLHTAPPAILFTFLVEEALGLKKRLHKPKETSRRVVTGRI